MAKKATSTIPAAKASAAKAGSRPPAPAKASSTSAPAAKAAPKAPTKAASTAKASASKAPAKSKVTAKAVAKPVMTVTTKHMAAALAEKQAMPKKQADALLAEVFGMVVDHLKGGDRVRITGIGIIEVKDRPARMGRNPATGEPISIKASRKIAFRAAKELKAAV